MTAETAARTYTGIARVLDRNGLLIDVGKAELMVNEDEGSWEGSLSVFKGSSLEAKHITGLIELADGKRSLATVGPKSGDLGNDLISVPVNGVDRSIPF